MCDGVRTTSSRENEHFPDARNDHKHRFTKIWNPDDASVLNAISYDETNLLQIPVLAYWSHKILSLLVYKSGFQPEAIIVDSIEVIMQNLSFEL